MSTPSAPARLHKETLLHAAAIVETLYRADDAGMIEETLRRLAATLPSETAPSDAAAEYARRNPLGGPAVVFEAMASRVRAGENFYEVLDDYGFSVQHGQPEVLAEYGRGDGRADGREWHSQGAWLRQGDRIIVQRASAAAPILSAPSGGSQTEAHPPAASAGETDIVRQLNGALVNSEGADFQIAASFVRELAEYVAKMERELAEATARLSSQAWAKECANTPLMREVMQRAEKAEAENAACHEHIRSDDAEIDRLHSEVAALTHDAALGQRLEGIICQFSHFTGDPPYVGNEGVELALRETFEENAALKRDAINYRTVMIAAAEEIGAHWEAYCDTEGYGPRNLLRRLEEGIPVEYGYTAGAFKKLDEEVKALRSDIARHVEIACKEAAARVEAENRLYQTINRGLNHEFFEGGLAADTYEMTTAEAYVEGWRDAWLSVTDDAKEIYDRARSEEKKDG